MRKVFRNVLKTSMSLIIFTVLAMTALIYESTPVQAGTTLTATDYSYTSSKPASGDWKGNYATVKNHRYRYSGGKIQVKIVWGTCKDYTVSTIDGKTTGYDYFWLVDSSGNQLWTYWSQRSIMDSNNSNTFTMNSSSTSHSGHTFYYKEGDTWVSLSGAAPTMNSITFSGSGSSLTANFTATANKTSGYTYDYAWYEKTSTSARGEYDPIVSSVPAIGDPIVGFYYYVDTNSSNSAVNTSTWTKTTSTDTINVGGYNNASTNYYVHVAAISYTGKISAPIVKVIPKNWGVVNQYHYYNHPVNGWTWFKTTTDTRQYNTSFAPYNTTAPTGYYAGNNYGYYDTSSNLLGSGTVGSNSFTVNQNINVHVHYYPNSYYFDLNGYLDGATSGNISGFGTADVYINGSRVADDVTDWYQAYSYDSTYEIKDIKTTAGHTYNGAWSSGNPISGTIKGTTGVYLNYTTNSYTSTVIHYKYDPVNDKWINFNSSSTSRKYGSSFTPSFITPPTGYYAGSYNTWTSDYKTNLGSGAVTMPAANTITEVYYHPLHYNLTVKPNWGTWNGSIENQTFEQSYTTTKSIAAPTKTGYTFAGWAEIGAGTINNAWHSNGSFNNGNAGGFYVYNNAGDGTVTHNIQSASSDNPIGSGYEVKITNNGAGTSNPGLGGFWHQANSSANQKFMHTFIAKVPKGYYLQIARNGIGTGGSHYWLSDNAGTGQWETYSYYVSCGSSGDFSTFGHVYLSGPSGAVSWYVAYSNIYNVTNGVDATTTYTYGAGDGSLYALYYKNIYNNTRTHWLFGFQNGEGNNTDKKAYNLKNEDFNARYESTYTISKDQTVTPPNGTYAADYFGTSGISGSWGNYTYPYTVTQPAHSVSYQYNYFVKDYNITYNLNGGTNSSSNPSTYNVLYGFTLSNPTKEDYTFDGWYLNETKINGINIDTVSFNSVDELYSVLENRTTGDLTLEARWTPIKYTVTFNSNNGGYIIDGSGVGNVRTISKQTYLTDTSLANLTNAGISGVRVTDTTNEFKGWYTATSGGTQIYDMYGEVVNDGTYFKDGKWIARENVTLYAQYGTKTYQYTINHYKQNVNGNGYTLAGSVSNRATANTSITAPTRNYTGFKTPTAKKITISATGTNIVNYYYDRISYTVTAKVGTGVSSVTGGNSYLYGATVTMGATLRPGYKWDSNSKWISSSTSLLSSSSVINYSFAMPAGNVTLTANATPITYSVKFNGNGSTSGSMSNQSFTYDVAQNLTAENFTREFTVTYNYNGNGSSNTTAKATATFVGWATSSTGSVVYSNQQSVSNLTSTNGTTVNLYAKWTDGKITLPTPTRTGYTFSGWYDAATGGNKIGNGGTTYTLSENKTLYAQWTPITYSISYDLAGGSLPSGKTNPTSYNIETETITLNNPIRTGYTFKGWTGSNGTTPQTTVTIAKGSTGNKTYTANWEANKYTIKFDPNGGALKNPGGNLNNGTNTDTVTVTYNNGSYYGMSGDIPIRTGYTFKGWYTATSGGTQVYNANGMSINEGTYWKDNKWVGTNNLTLYAQWTPITYSVKFNGNGSTSGSMSNQSFTYDVAQNLTAENFTREFTVTYNYNGNGSSNTTAKATATFAGWATSSTGSVVYTDKQSVSNLTSTNGTTVNLYAKWTDGKVTLPTPTRTGYTFSGWYDAATGGNKIGNGGATYTLSENKTLYARWTPITYSISYDLAGGSLPSGKTNPTTYNIETETITLNNPIRTGYTFKGWTGSNGTTPQTTVTIAKGSTGNKTYTANWEANKYTIKFDPNGGTLKNPGGNLNNGTNTDTVTVTYDKNSYYGMSNDVPTRTGYTFTGWYTAKTGGTQIYTLGGMATNEGTYWKDNKWVGLSNLTLYAQWTPTIYTITYNLNGGAVTPANPTTYTIENSDITLNNPTKVGYTFAGWTGSNGSTPQTTVTIKTGSYGNKTYTANWTPIIYDITYDLNGDLNDKVVLDPGNPTEFTIESGSITLKNPELEGYIFTGWTGSNGSTPQTTVTIPTGSINDKNYKANWEPIKYQIVYNGNGQTGGSTATSTHTYDIAQQLTPNGYVKEGYFFLEWNTRPDGSGTVYRDKEVVENLTNENNGQITLYAIWHIAKFTVTFDGNGGITPEGNPTVENEATYSEDYTVPENPFNKDGYTFVEWNTEPDGSGDVWTPGETFEWTAMGDTTVYAQWDKKPEISLKDFLVVEGDTFPESNLIDGNGYITHEITDFPEYLITVTYPVTAEDEEDGDITDRIKVEKVVGPNGETLTNVDTSKPGDYVVYYSVTDNAGGTTTANRTITVLPASVPEIKANDRWYYRGDEVTEDDLLSKVIATDKYDGNILDNVVIKDFDKINPDVTGEYEITYEVTNRSHETVTKTVTVHIIDTVSDIEKPCSIRYINAEFIDTLDAESKWRTNSELRAELANSLLRKDASEALYRFTFTADDVKAVKEDIRNNGFKK